MKLLIKITKKILERSANCGSGPDKSNLGTNCAIALAVRDIFPHANVKTWEILPVYYKYERINLDRRQFGIQLPEEASDFIRTFDHNTPEDRKIMSELEFEVDISDELINEITIDIDLINKSETLELV